MSKQRLRILFVEDCREDVEIEERELRRAGLLFDAVRVETGEELYLALEESAPSLIISDYTLPQMDGLRALRIAHALRPEVPFIFVSGTIGEERAVEGLKRGAADYVHKDNLSGLIPAVQRALRDAREREERRKQEEKRPETPPQDAFLRLSGAFAADLDDLLTVIAGYTQLTREHVQNDEVQRYLDQVLRATDRAAQLSRRLFALGCTPVFRAELLDLNTVLVAMEGRIRSVIGGAIGMSGALDWRLGRLMADRGQVEQVALHLAVNAREAMPGGGTLSFETSNAEPSPAELARNPSLAPGRFVLLTVRHCGPAPVDEDRDRPFEPFDSPGRAGGLGISIATGIVRSMGGTILVDPESEGGTRVRVYLPRVDPAPKN